MSSVERVTELIRESGLARDTEMLFATASMLRVFFQMNGLDPIETLIALEVFQSTLAAGLRTETGTEQVAKASEWQAFEPKLQAALKEMLDEGVALFVAQRDHVGEVGNA